MTPSPPSFPPFAFLFLLLLSFILLLSSFFFLLLSKLPGRAGNFMGSRDCNFCDVLCVVKAISEYPECGSTQSRNLDNSGLCWPIPYRKTRETWVKKLASSCLAHVQCADWPSVSLVTWYGAIWSILVAFSWSWKSCLNPSLFNQWNVFPDV